MYDTCHPVFHEMGKLGCTNLMQNTTAFQAYMELTEAKRLWDVQYNYNQPLDLIYLEARKSKSSQLEKYIPWPAKNNISLVQIEKMQKELDTKRLILIFMEGDSTSVYYCISAGLVKPSSPEQSKEFKRKEEKRIELENKIKRNAANLYELAMSVSKEKELSSKD